MTDLVERLRKYALSWQERAASKAIVDEAATAIEAKDAEIAALRTENVRLKQHADLETLSANSLFDEGLVLYDTLKTTLARAETAERELSREREAFQRHEQTLRDNGIGSHSEAVVLVTELRRERDEARAALKPLAFLAKGPVSDLIKHIKTIAPSLYVLAKRAHAIIEE